MTLNKTLKIGSRGSPLALIQAKMVESAIQKEYPEQETEIVPITTSGDWKPEHGESLLPERQGGKALFAKEIEEQLLDKRIDLAVHSMKDMDSDLPKGLVINHMLPRDDPRDALVLSSKHKSRRTTNPFDTLPEGAKIGTSSARRKAFLLHHRPDLQCLILRGNVGTRLEKLETQDIDATFLGVAGLQRLNMDHHIDYSLKPDFFIPSGGQGTIGIEIRQDDKALSEMLDQISDPQSVLCNKAERAFVRALNGKCQSPIGVYAQIKNETLYLEGAICNEDGTCYTNKAISGKANTIFEAQNLGEELAQAIARQAKDISWLTK